MHPSSSVSRGSRWILAPLLLVILLAVAWTGAWFYGAHRAEGTVAAWIEREAQASRLYACGSRTVGGYPFRIEMRCRAPRAEMSGMGRPLTVQGGELLAVAQVYQPDLVIAELSGPVTIGFGGDPGEYVADWSLFQASIRGVPWSPERMSLVLDGPKLVRAGPAQEPVVRAQRLELHARLKPDSDAGSHAFDLVAKASAAIVTGVPTLGERPIDIDIAAELRGIKDLAPKPFVEKLREWQGAGGRLEITQARFAQGEAVAVAKGVLGLSANARLDGVLPVTLAGLEQIGSLIFGQGNRSRTQAGLLAGLVMLGGGAELEGKRAITVPLRFRDGGVFFGPVPLGQTPPLY